MFFYPHTLEKSPNQFYRIRSRVIPKIDFGPEISKERHHT